MSADYAKYPIQKSCITLSDKCMYNRREKEMLVKSHTTGFGKNKNVQCPIEKQWLRNELLPKNFPNLLSPF